MKNRTTFNFNVDRLDGLLSDNNLELLKEELLSIFQHSSGIDWIFILKRYVFAFPEDEIIKTPQFLTFAAVEAFTRGDMVQTLKYAKLLDGNLLLSHYINVYTPLTNNKIFRKSIEYLKNTEYFHATFSSCRPSITNNIRDFTRYNRWLEYLELPLKKELNEIYKEHCTGMFEIAMAEYYYQQDKCYDALSSLESVIDEIQRNGNPAVLQAALYVRMRIMIAKKQVSRLQPLIDDFETKIQKINYSLYPGYIDSLRIWFALYEGDYERAANWLAAEVPYHNDTFTIMNLFSLIIKLRVYLQFGKYYILTSAVERLIPILESWHREMDLCEVYLIHAMGLFSDNNFEKAYTILDTVLPIIKRRKYYRLVADEGEKMYHMLRLYKKERNLSDECIDKLIALSRETGLIYPNYLKKLAEKYPALTDAEKSVLKLMSDERSNMEIAEYLNISINTVKFHNKNIFTKLNVNNRHQAIRAAQAANII